MGIFSDLSSLLSLCLRVFTSTFPHRQNSLIHYTISTQSSLFVFPFSSSFSQDSQWISVVQFLLISLTVLFTINHVKFLSFLVGGPTFFYPHLMYEFTQTFSSSSRVQVSFFSPSLLPLVSKFFPISLATTFGISVDFFTWY